MRHVVLMAATLAWLAAGSAAEALDSVRLLKGGTVNGRVTKMSPTEVEVEGAGGLTKAVPVNEIDVVLWDDEPSQIKTARQHLKEANFQSAMQTLEKITLPGNARPELKQDLEFYTAFTKAQMALAGQGEIREAGSQMAAFVKNNPGNYHWLHANEVVGDLLVPAGAFDRAVEYYATVGKAPWPDYKMRAGVAMGRALLAQDKVAEAEKQFDAVLAIRAEGEMADAQRLAARLGKARCLAANKKTEEAIKDIESIIERANAEQTDLLAQAYNALGNAYAAAGKTKEAIFAFLHVDLLYYMNGDAHAEALANLVLLWKKDNKPERAQRALQTLESRYRNSPWLKKATG